MLVEVLEAREVLEVEVLLELDVLDEPVVLLVPDVLEVLVSELSASSRPRRFSRASV